MVVLYYRPPEPSRAMEPVAVKQEAAGMVMCHVSCVVSGSLIVYLTFEIICHSHTATTDRCVFAINSILTSKS